MPVSTRAPHTLGWCSDARLVIKLITTSALGRDRDKVSLRGQQLVAQGQVALWSPVVHTSLLEAVAAVLVVEDGH